MDIKYSEITYEKLSDYFAKETAVEDKRLFKKRLYDFVTFVLCIGLAITSFVFMFKTSVLTTSWGKYFGDISKGAGDIFFASVVIAIGVLLLCSMLREAVENILFADVLHTKRASDVYCVIRKKWSEFIRVQEILQKEEIVAIEALEHRELIVKYRRAGSELIYSYHVLLEAQPWTMTVHEDSLDFRWVDKEINLCLIDYKLPAIHVYGLILEEVNRIMKESIGQYPLLTIDNIKVFFKEEFICFESGDFLQEESVTDFVKAHVNGKRVDYTTAIALNTAVLLDRMELSKNERVQ